jgi:hypothetical protein
MGLDTGAGAVALGQLQSIPFRSIIGGPLCAAIEAQAKAAQTTVDFIKAVGFTDVDGKLKAVNLEFTYEDGTGAFRRVTVPLLLVIPIPFIVIETVDIDFKARISASAQQSTESSSESTEAASVTARARFWGQSLDISGSYSAKKDSKAAQESKYSVEYTLDVRVHATQAGLPQGMQAVLNILQDGISNANQSGQVTVFGLDRVLVSTSGAFPAGQNEFFLLVVDQFNEPVVNAPLNIVAQNGLVTPTATATSAGVYKVTITPTEAVTVTEAEEMLVITATVGSEEFSVSRPVSVRKAA